MGLLCIGIVITNVFITHTLCSIAGVSYLDEILQRPLEKKEDPCNPLYWYPRDIPEYCFRPPVPEVPYIPAPAPPPIPVPIPVPMPPMPMPVPPPYPYPVTPKPCPDQNPVPPLKIMPPMQPMPLLPAMPMPAPFMPMPIPPLPVFPTPPLPYGMPIVPTNPMVPIGGYPYPYMPGPPVFQQGIPGSMVPGIRGLVSPDGGINILPFSDAYTELMERHRQRMITKKLEILMKEYDAKRNSRGRKRGRKIRLPFGLEE